MALMHQAEQLAVGDEACCIPVYYYATTWICIPEITGVTTYPTVSVKNNHVCAKACQCDKLTS